MAVGPSQFGRLNIWAMLKDLVNNNVGLFVNSGAPTNGTSGTLAGFAGPGALVVDITNGALYINTGTKASPFWTAGSPDNVADQEAGVPQIFRVTAAALTGNVDIVLNNKIRVIDAWCVHTAAAGVGDTITVQNGANAITDAMDLNVADQTVVRAGTINDAFWDIAAGGTLRIAGASAVDAEVFVQAIRVA